MLIEKSTFAAFKADPALTELLAEYAVESGIDGLPKPKMKAEIYQHLESMGLLQVFVARKDSRMIGFIFVVATLLPHYSALIAVSESFFVAKAYRRTGAGLKLLEVAENRAAEAGCSNLLVSAPYGGDLFQVLPHRGYSECSRIFVKAVPHV